MDSWYSTDAEQTIINCKVIPSASRNGFGGVRNGELVVRVNAPPEKGKANKELIKFLAKSLGIGRSALSLVSGDTSRNKRVSVNYPLSREMLKTLCP